MALVDQFNIENTRAVHNASCTSVPAVMLIAGPNGCGKSTLLNALRNQYRSESRFLYVGPHRDPNPQSVSLPQIFNADPSMAEALSEFSISSNKGVALTAGSRRDPWGLDSAGNFLKPTIVKLDEELMRAVASKYKEEGHVSAEEHPDVWDPLRELTEHLLPHLTFAGVDTENPGNVRCEWEVHGADNLVDLNDLSSGERAVIQLFFPLVEHRIRHRLEQIQNGDSDPQVRPATLVIDEPELHLHPKLQVKVLDYFRELASELNMQFIAATQSATMVDYATEDELYILRPPKLVSEGENHLVKAAGDEESLEELREVFGGTANLTSLEPVVVVEGVSAERGSNVMTDRKLYRELYPLFDEVNIISGGGKYQAERLGRAIREYFWEIPVATVVLLDRDVDTEEPDEDWIRLLPVSNIENLLLDADAIWQSIEAVAERTDLSSRADVEDALNAILQDMDDYEVQRRVKKHFGVDCFRVSEPVSEAAQQAEEFSERLQERVSPDEVESALNQARTKVEEIQTQDARRRYYDGKRVLNEFVSRHLHSAGMSKPIFKFLAARFASLDWEHESFFKNVFASLGVEGR